MRLLPKPAEVGWNPAPIRRTVKCARRGLARACAGRFGSHHSGDLRSA